MSEAAERDPARLIAPVLALLAATLVVLLLRYVLHGGDESRAVPPAQPPPPADTRPARPPPPPAARPPAAPPASAARTYTIQSGDTLGAVAERHDVSLQALLDANPGVDPVALRAGQEIRLP